MGFGTGSTSNDPPLAPARRVPMGIGNMANSKTVLVLGGKGGLSQHYREAAEHEGYELLHFENRVPPKTRHGIGKAALVVVMVSMISHSLAERVRELAPAGAEVVYLRSPSVSAFRNAISARDNT